MHPVGETDIEQYARMSCLPPYSTSAARLLCDEHVSESSPSASSKVLLLLGGSVPGIMLLPVRDCFFYQP